MNNLCEISDEQIDDNSNKSSHSPASAPVFTTTSCLSTSPLMSPNTSKSLLPQQAIRSELRRDFLRLLSSLHKRKVLLKLYECPLILSATFDGCDHNFSQLFLSSFKTPIGLEKSAIVRTNDVIELEFVLNDRQQKTNTK